VRVPLEVIHTSGDRERDRPLPEIGGKGLFTRELDRALLDGEIDLAVHSLKDLPTAMEPGLEVACVPRREDPRDVLVGPDGPVSALQSLPRGATVGTSSLRRRALALAFRPDLHVENVRGNIDTRIRKLDEGEYDALVMAAAGLRRLGMAGRISEWLEQTVWLPAPGQGALGIVIRRGDERVKERLRRIAHEPSEAAVRAERALLETLEGGCQLPIGALGLPYEGGLRLWGIVASPDGRRLVRADSTDPTSHPEELGRRVADLLLSRGADELLALVGTVTNPQSPS
jgi:hydroxymethylbilane synthase